jgi:hypothetical protein
VKYIINGKEYSELDINKRCAGIMGFAGFSIWKYKFIYLENLKEYDPCNNPPDTWPIIDKVWDELLDTVTCYHKDTAEWDEIRWKHIMQKHNCTKLVAACICLIECNG